MALMMPLFGAARISQAMAPRKGGVTKDAVTSPRTIWRPGMSVRATIHARGVATMQERAPTHSAIVMAVTKGRRSVDVGD